MNFRILASLFCLVILSGCAGKAQWNAEMPYEPNAKAKVGDILHMSTGHYISEAQMLANATVNPLVYVGELHDNPASHRLQLEVLRAMAKRHPGKLSLGMEMFTTKQQDVLDRWVAGKLSEKEFLRQSRWFTEGWSFDFGYYRAILEFCRDNRIPVVGLNVDKELGKKVSMTPLEELPPEVRAQLPEMDMSDPYQRAMIEAMVADHASSGKMVESFHRRQTLWDETMAQSVADYLHTNPGMSMMVIAGGWHVEYGFGIPRRVFRRLPLAYTIIGSRTIKIAEGKDPQLMNVTMPQFPMPEADYMVYQEYELLEKKGVRLGVLLDDKGDERGVLVAGVMPGSVAEAAGINKGERIISFDGVSVEDNFDIIYAVKNKSPGDTGHFVIAGEDGERNVEVTFVAHKRKHHGK
ncbi:MAG: ChaN family lipoprotein [Thermodesulfobacteriota bacterium]